MTGDFELEIPDGLAVHRDVGGADLVVAVGEIDDPAATLITVMRGEAVASRDEHVARVRASLERDLDPHLVDQAVMPLGGHDAWWTVDAFARDGRSLVLDTWMLVHDDVGWTVSLRMPWVDVHHLRDGGIAIVSTLRFA